jgi:hypothetical protein
MYSDCEKGKRTYINVVGEQHCAKCDSSRRQYQSESGQARCETCFGRVNDKATECTIGIDDSEIYLLNADILFPVVTGQSVKLL